MDGRIFTVLEIRYTNPITYKIVDYINEEIKGTFDKQRCRRLRKLFKIE